MLDQFFLRRGFVPPRTTNLAIIPVIRNSAGSPTRQHSGWWSGMLKTEAMVLLIVDILSIKVPRNGAYC